MAMNYDDRELTYEIVEEIGIIATQPTGWTKELNLVAWNGGQAKYDIREWSPHHDRMSKGVTLNEQEMRMIMEMLKRRTRFVPRGTNVISQPQETAQGSGYAGSGGNGNAAAAHEATAAPAAGSTSGTPDDDSLEAHPEAVVPENAAGADAAAAF